MAPLSRRPLLAGALALLAAPASAQARFRDGSFTTSDGVRLHYLESGRGRTLVLVPGWTMPAWIFQVQITDFARSWHVVALDPRSQGDSEIAVGGHEPFRRGRDIVELLDHLGDAQVVLVGWSLGVLDVLSCIHQFGDTRVAGLVLVDNSVGEEPAPVAEPTPRRRARGRLPPRPVSREVAMAGFVRSMFRSQPSAYYLQRLTEAALRTPPAAASALLNYPVPRSFWRDAIYSTGKPILYVVRPQLSGQADNLQAHHAGAESVVLRDVGHAMFVDDPTRFDTLVASFIRRRIWTSP